MRRALASLMLVACSSSSAVEERPGLDAGPVIATPNVPSDGGFDAAVEAGEARYVDPCTMQASTCSDRCGFPLVEMEADPALADAVAAQATVVTVADVVADANRIAEQGSVPGSPAGVQLSFRWQSDDENTTAWIPQGISGSADGTTSGLVDGKRVVLVSWYYTPPSGDPERGVRIAFVDVTNPAATKYRFLLLVEPKAGGTIAPVDVHAGGIVWSGDRLWVADTSTGFRVFDLKRILRVATDTEAIGCAAGVCNAFQYAYVAMQVARYRLDTSCDAIFSWVSLDKSSSPPSLVSGEYCSTTACSGPLAGRIMRWPLDGDRLRSERTFPTELVTMGHTQVQGGASKDGVFYLSSSAPANDGGELVRLKSGKSVTSGWSNNPEDLMVDGNSLWCISEAAGSRAVYAAALASYPPP